MSDEIDISLDEVLPDNPPTLYDINKSFEVISTDNYSGLVGEEEARMVIFTNFILGEKPCILKGSRASGKTNTIRIVNAYAKKPIDIASSSEKAHQRNKNLNDYSHFVIPEINKVNDKVIEMLKDFGEGEKHQYSFTNPYKDVETIEIEPKAFITSIADENKNVDALGEELLSRVTVVRTDSSVKQNIDVIEEKLKRAANPFYKKDLSQDEVNKYIAYVQSLPSIKNFKFVYPAGEVMRTAIPPLFTDSRRDTDKYLANTYGITLFHFRNRMKVAIGKTDYLLVTPADIWYNHVVYQNILLESSLKCGKIEQEILRILKEDGETPRTDNWGNNVRGLKVGDIHTELLKLSYTPTVDSVKKMCDGLMEIGYVTRNEEVRPYRYQINPELNREYEINISWDKVVRSCADRVKQLFPAIADDYVSRFCEGDGLIVVHPFTGEKLSILDGVKKESNVEKVIHKNPVIDSEGSDSTFTPSNLEDLKKQNEELKKSIHKEEPVINIDLGVVDDQDNLQDKLLSLISKNERFIYDCAKELNVSNEEVDDMIAYMVKIGEAVEVRPGVYKRL